MPGRFTLSGTTGLHPKRPLRAALAMATLTCVAFVSLPAAAFFSGMTMPIYATVSPSSVVGGLEGFSATFDTGEIPPGGGSIQIGCSHPELIGSPSGSWPYHRSFAYGGPTTQSVMFTTSAVAQDTEVTIYASEEGADLNDPSNWRVQALVVLRPQ